MISYIKKELAWKKQYHTWKQKNQHNFTEIQLLFPIDQVSIGNNTYGMINPHIYGNTTNHLSIGAFCSIAENVHFLFGEHDYHRISTYPFKKYMLGLQEDEPAKGDIIIEDDVWIGMNCMILSGVTIHQGAVIGAGSIVTKDVPPYAVFVGGKVVKYRFSADIIQKLLKIDFSIITKEYVQKHLDLFYSHNIEQCINEITDK